MAPFAHVVLIGWIGVVIGLFAFLPPRRAAIVAFIGGYLFLPVASIPIAGLPDYTKVAAVGVAALVGAALCDTSRLLSFRPHLLDLPMFAWCIMPFVSGQSNGFDLYDSAAAALAQTVNWGVPYVLGRVYLKEPEAVRELAIGVFMAGLVYIPFCLWESRMSPLLHYNLYGYRPGAMVQRTFGFWGPLRYTPVVFMGDYLHLTIFMGATAVVGYWLWTTGAVRQLFGVSLRWLVPALFVATVLCKGVGGIALMLLGALALFLVKRLRTSLPVLCLLLAPPVYVSLRATESWSGVQLVDLAEATVGPDRAASLNCRLMNEARLMTRAFEKPLLGWGPWGDYRQLELAPGDPKVLTDSLWIITFGKYGVVGLSLLMAVFAAPGLTALRSLRGRSGSHPASAPVGALCVAASIYGIDCLFNALLNPIFFLVLGALAGAVPALEIMRHAQRGVAHGPHLGWARPS